MGAERSGLAGVSRDPGSGSLDTDFVSVDRIEPTDGADQSRWRGELEQLHVTIEDLEQQIAVLLGENADLNSRLAAESRRREKAEHQVQQLLAHPPASAADRSVEITLRNELSTALEELQVMQEELQAAHDALCAGRLGG